MRTDETSPEIRRRAVLALVSPSGVTHVRVVRELPAVLQRFGSSIGAALAESGLPANLFEDRDRAIDYRDLARLMAVSARLTQCDYVGGLAGQRTRLADFGLPGRLALCAPTAGDGLRRFVECFNLHSSATTVNLVSEGSQARFSFAVAVPDIAEMQQIQVGSVTIAFNLLRELFGPKWHPTVLTFACRAPADLQELRRHFQAPMRFDSSAATVVFERHWLDRTLPTADPAQLLAAEAELRALRSRPATDWPASLRILLRKQLLSGRPSMTAVAGLLGMHRRTLDRHLDRRGLSFRELLESVQLEVATQLLRDTQIEVQGIAEALHFSSAANFTTAFRRWTGLTPTEFRRRRNDARAAPALASA